MRSLAPDPALRTRGPVLRAQSDERLVLLAGRGLEPAFDALVARHEPPLLRYCGRLLDDYRAEDVVQQTFVRAYETIAGGNGIANLRPWLYRVAHNGAIDALRDRALQHEQLDESYDGVERPDQAYERRHDLRDVVAVVNALPPRQRDALVLRELEGRSYAEIAVELGVTGGAVRQLLMRARATLRAGASAVTPTGLVARLPLHAGSEPVTARVAELASGAGGPVVVAQVCTAIVACSVVVGGSPDVPRQEPPRDGAQHQAPFVGSERTLAAPGALALAAGGPGPPVVPAAPIAERPTPADAEPPVLAHVRIPARDRRAPVEEPSTPAPPTEPPGPSPMSGELAWPGAPVDVLLRPPARCSARRARRACDEDNEPGTGPDSGTSPDEPATGTDQASADGSAPADGGDQASADGSAPPADGSAPPADGSAPPADGSAPPADGSAPADGGDQASADGSAPPTDGPRQPAAGPQPAEQPPASEEGSSGG